MMINYNRLAALEGLSANAILCGHSRRRAANKDNSNHSILSSMDKFVRAVEDMNETILVPCRLMDLSGGGGASDSGNKAQRQLSASTDLYAFYSMLNGAKNELQWGSSAAAASATATANTENSAVKTHVRRHSSASLTSSSSSSASASDVDSEVCSVEGSNDGGDSGLESDEDYAAQMAENFHRHLSGLHQCLKELTLAAEFVTTRYQNDVGGSS